MSAEVVHRLGVAVGITLLLVWLVRWLEGVRRRRRTRQRLAELLALSAMSDTARPSVREVVRRWLPEVAVVCAGWAVGGGLVGVALGLVGAGVMGQWRRRQRAADAMSEADARVAARQLPLGADLLAACIAAGAGPVIAAQAVGEALGGPVGEGLARGAAEVRLGGEPGTAWRRLAEVPGAASLARLLERADVSGLPAAGPVARLAADARAEWARAGTARARRAAVMVTAPVGHEGAVSGAAVGRAAGRPIARSTGPTGHQSDRNTRTDRKRRNQRSKTDQQHQLEQQNHSRTDKPGGINGIEPHGG